VRSNLIYTLAKIVPVYKKDYLTWRQPRNFTYTLPFRVHHAFAERSDLANTVATCLLLVRSVSIYAFIVSTIGEGVTYRMVQAACQH